MNSERPQLTWAHLSAGLGLEAAKPNLHVNLRILDRGVRCQFTMPVKSIHCVSVYADTSG